MRETLFEQARVMTRGPVSFCVACGDCGAGVVEEVDGAGELRLAMHNPAAEGNAYFVCDFCRNHFDEDRPMIEGHKGSLICSKCITPAYVSLIHLGEGSELAGTMCTMCLEERSQPQWASPLHPEVHICLRCIKQGAGVLSKDPDYGWQKPPAPETGSRVVDDEDIDPDVV